MAKIALLIHAGAGSLDHFLKNNIKLHEQGLKNALDIGYKELKNGKSAEDVVELAVKILEDNPLFNAGKGSALNSNGEVEMDGAIMNGKTLKAGACSAVKYVKNPVSLARIIMNNTKHVFLTAKGAMDFAKANNLIFESEEYFITEQQLHMLNESKQELLKKTTTEQQSKKKHGTVGAVALDKNGDLCAATSTGGIDNSLPGRVGDSCIIGAGCYADNNTCALSATGIGENIIKGVMSHTISMCVENGMELQEACDYVVFKRNPQIFKELGVIGLNRRGEIAIAFNTPVMKRAYISSDNEAVIKIF